MKALVVDDLPTMRRILRKFLTEFGFRDIVEATDGEKALAMLESDNFDIIFSDWDMPNMTGIQLLERVRGIERFTKLPFIFVTANKSKEHVLRAAHLGASGYMCKPFNRDALMSKLNEIFKNSESETESEKTLS